MYASLPHNPFVISNEQGMGGEVSEEKSYTAYSSLV
jgi:hypothetical protein